MTVTDPARETDQPRMRVDGVVLHKVRVADQRLVV